MFQRGQRILLWGAFAERKTRLHFMLRKLGLEICSQLHETVDCIIWGAQQSTPPPPSYPSVSEEQALRYLQAQTERAPSLTEAELLQVQNLRRLLQHPAPINRTLGLSLLSEKWRPHCLADLLFAALEYRDAAVQDYLAQWGSPALQRGLRNADVLSLEDLALRVEGLSGERLASLFWQKSQLNQRREEAAYFLLKYSNQQALRQNILQSYVHADGNLLLHDFLERYCSQKEIEQLQGLRVVTLQGDYFKALPPALKQHQQLRGLHLNNIGLSEQWDLRAFPRLYYLRFSAMPLEKINALLPQAPAHLGRLWLLHIPEASAAAWANFYRLIGRFKQLQELYLQQCHLADFPPLQQLPPIRHLDASNNHIQQLPEEEHLLENLHSLNLYGNHLERLPKALFRYSPLREAIFSNNSPALNDWLYAEAQDCFPEDCEVKFDNVR